MKYGLLLMVLVAAIASGFLVRNLGERGPNRIIQSIHNRRLPLSQTLGVLGMADVVSVDPNDPLLNEVSSKKSTVTALPASLAADGVTNTTVVVTLRTEAGDLVSGAQVSLESNRGQQDTIEIVRGISGADGQAIFLLRSLETGTVVLTARAGTKLLDQRSTIKFVDAPLAPYPYNARIVWAGLGAILLIIFFQYLFARLVLSARSREEEELFFHHPQVLTKSGTNK